MWTWMQRLGTNKVREPIPSKVAEDMVLAIVPLLPRVC